MADRSTAAQRAWVERVLGLKLSQTEARSNAPASVIGIWRDAKDEVDRRIEALGQAIRAGGDQDLIGLLDRGFFGFGRTEAVGLMVALRELEATVAADRPAAVSRVRAAARDLATLVASSKLVQLIDKNPYGVRTDIRMLTFRALQDVSAAIG